MLAGNIVVLPDDKPRMPTSRVSNEVYAAVGNGSGANDVTEDTMYFGTQTSQETTGKCGKLTSSVETKSITHITPTNGTVMSVDESTLQDDVCGVATIQLPQAVTSTVAGTVRYNRDKHGLQDRIVITLPSKPTEATKPIRSNDARVLSVKRGVHPVMHQKVKGGSSQKKKEGQKLIKITKKMPQNFQRVSSPI